MKHTKRAGVVELSLLGLLAYYRKVRSESSYYKEPTGPYQLYFCQATTKKEPSPQSRDRREFILSF